MIPYPEEWTQKHKAFYILGWGLTIVFCFIPLIFMLKYLVGSKKNISKFKRLMAIYGFYSTIYIIASFFIYVFAPDNLSNMLLFCVALPILLIIIIINKDYA